ncbi:MAG: 30S ribosomal protein S12 methylthiotransferase RimO [Acidobacteriota bacterium]|nr:30S ribosomal protein S12 methylthiotransferase RimO [Acidobacteriota bacterium]
MSERSRPRDPRRRVALVSLGCPKNQVDSELILGRLADEGAELVDDPDRADTLIINTCAFIDRARAESVDALLDAVAWKSAEPGRTVVAAGCLVQRAGDELAAEIPELDGLVGLDDIAAVAAVVPTETRPPALPRAARALPRASSGPARRLFDHLSPRRSLSPPWWSYVKIAEGCDQRCAFCAIPTFRGRMRSRPIADVSAELAAAARRGVVEANLVAQDSTGYGRDIGLSDGLAKLVCALDALPEAPPWIRIHYLYPGRISRGLLDAMRSASRLVEYVDLPLQHADEGVLRRMGRPGNADSYLKQLDHLREALPGAGVRSGFIVGFPGETDAAFDELCRFVDRAGLDAAGVFTYSHEHDTTAFDLDDDVPPEVKSERKEALEEVAASVAHERNRARIGTRLEVLTEGAADDVPGATAARWRGQAPDVDGRVLVEDGAAIPPGSLVSVTITDAGPHELVARMDRAEASP